jgi:predicted DCC family thiol-disulfide oxidoreductase YuxK
LEIDINLKKYSLEKTNSHIIIFDGVCNLCNGAVNFIIKRDKHNRFVFTPMQSKFAKGLIDKHHQPKGDLDTIILVKHNAIFIRSEAVLEITKDLSGLWFLLRVFKIFPIAVRDYLYKVLAKNRYKIFGKREACMVPTPEYEDRFIQ